MRLIRDLWLGSIPFVLALALWQFLSSFAIFPKWLIASPLATAKTLIEVLADGTLPRLLLASTLNAVPAFIAAFVCALAAGTLIGLSDNLRRMCFPLLSALYPIPSLAWLPLVILCLGFTRASIWAVIFLSAFLRIVYNVIAGVRGVKPEWILAAKNFGLTRFQVILRVILPAALPQIVTGMRLGFGSSWRSLIGAEMLVVSIGGLGNFIWYAQWYFAFDKVFVGLFVIATIGITVEYLVFRPLENRSLVRWGMVREEIR